MESNHADLMSLKDWWNLGRNDRVEGENQASWAVLFKDDLAQLTHSNEAFTSGKTSVWSWRPLSAFSPKMVRTGPSPLVRQFFERPIRALFE